ncbi:MAG: hypothetical protein IMZ66_06255, partial [Planctomycetes bacterium]|nr:hypothetical protein [Planctomycetota bacterium]
KMGKSLGNFITLEDAFEKWDPMVLRMFILQTHYRSQTDFSEEAMAAATSGFENLKAVLPAKALAMVSAIGKEQPRDRTEELVTKARTAFFAAMDDDFNTARALGQVFQLATAFRAIADAPEATLGDLNRLSEVLGDFLDILGIQVQTGQSKDKDSKANQEIVKILLKERQEARRAKQFGKADEIRDKLISAGFKVLDLKDGSSQLQWPSGTFMITD